MTKDKIRKIVQEARGETILLTKRELTDMFMEACGVMSPEMTVLEPEKDARIMGHGGTARMAKGSLFNISKVVQSLHDRLNDEDELPEWVQSKIAAMLDDAHEIEDHLGYKIHQADLAEDVRKVGDKYCAYVDDKVTKKEKENNPEKYKYKRVGSLEKTKSGKIKMKARACYRSKKKANNAMAAAMIG